jgi:hypothetical protein
MYNPEEIRSLPRIRGQSIDDFLLDGELERCERESLRNGNGSHPQRYCKCAELIINGIRMPYPPQHSCKYTDARSALVPEASRIATERIGDPLHDTPLGNRWTRAFNIEMDRLAVPLLRQSSNGTHER